MKLRFSLRTMLILMTCAAILCLWRDTPRRKATRFVEAIDARLYEEADVMFVLPEMAGVAKFIQNDDRNRITAKRVPQSPRDWLMGRCYVDVKAEDFDGLGASMVGRATVTSNGVHEVYIEQSTGIADYTPDPQIIRQEEFSD